LYFEAAKNMSPVISGVALFPWTFTTAPAAAIVGVIITKTGRWRFGIYSGWFLTVVGMSLLVLYKVTSPAAEYIPIALISGVGLGILYASMSFGIQASSTNRDLPFAAALYSFFRHFGQMLGVAIGGAIFQNQVKKQLLGYPSLASQANELSKDASALVEIIKAMPPQQAAIKADMIQAYVDALRTVWIVMACLAGAALVLGTIFTRPKSLERELETDQGFVGSKRTSDSQTKA
jgi:hypothetical protein